MSFARKLMGALLLATVVSAPAAAQGGGVITGRVIDAATQAPLTTATVFVVGTRLGTTTDADGNFRISGVPAGSHQITARSIGYAPVTQNITMAAGRSQDLDFALDRQAVVMDEIVVTGYGSQRRAAITGSVASLNAEEANVGVTTNATEMLQGRVSGLAITQNNGEPGAGVQIRVRGGTSISASNEPLYVIDGVPIQNLATEADPIGIGGSPALARNPLNLINPNDIESITVLKDAASAAIYGARAANGVILIETKQGQADRTTFEYDGYVAVGQAASSLGLLSGAQYRQFVNDEIAAGNLPASRANSLGTANTDWEDQVLRTAVTQNHNVSFSGGTQSTQYRGSLSYMDQEGIAINSGFERFTGRLNGTQYAWDDRLQLRLNLTASHTRNDYIPFENTGGFEGGVFQNMVQFNPTQEVSTTDAQGNTVFTELGAGTQSVRNPVALTEQVNDLANTTRVLGNVRIQMDVTDNLRGQLTVGVDRSESLRKEYIPRSSPVGAQWNGLARRQNRTLTGLTLQALGTYTNSFISGHDFELIGGYEFNDYNTDQFGAEAQNFLTDAFAFDNLAAGAQLVSPYSFVVDSRLIGFFSRATYGINDKYFVTGVFRRDGSTKFGADHKWATFPAVSGRWRISNENFAADWPFSELSLRGGWGTQGNEAVAEYASLLILAPSSGDSYPFGDNRTVGVAATRAANPALKWEETSQVNVGVDFGLNDNQISGSVEYYVKNTTDLLLTVPVPQPAVQSSRFENIGEVKNTGFEAQIDAVLINNADMQFDAGLVFTMESNEVSNLGGRSFITTGGVSGQGQSGQVSQRILPGYALGTFFGPEFTGVNGSGVQEFNDYDASGNLMGTTTTPGADDFVVIGDANADFTLGLRSSLVWGDFDMNIVTRMEQGRDVFNNTALVHGAKSNVLQDKNFLASSLNENDDINQPAIFSSRYIEDGSFFRIQNVTVGYTFEIPSFITSGRTARAYLSADNLLLLTGYTGYDPETHSDAGLASRGIDYLTYPRARTFTTGLRVNF